MLLTDAITPYLDITAPVFAESDLVADVVARLQKSGRRCAPLLHEGKALAMVTLADALAALPSSKKLCDMEFPPITCYGLHQHLFEIIAQMDTSSCTLLPVADENGYYVGVVEKAMLLEHIATMYHLREGAVTLELDVPSRYLKLSEVIATIEKNDTTVLSCAIYPSTPDSVGMIATFQLQTYDFFRLITNLEKYGYVIRYTSSFLREEHNEMREKALEVMRFMEM